MPDLKQINTTWTLFLDRDGVINEEKPDGYILHPQEFHFYPGVVEAIARLRKYFQRIIIVTNQRGIGRGLMQQDDLHSIHNIMLAGIEQTGGKIDHIYFAPELEDDAINRKPNPGMALQAKQDFPDIDFQKSVMVGNTLSDMQFGRNVGMCTVFLTTTQPQMKFPHPAIDLHFESLPAFVLALALMKS